MDFLSWITQPDAWVALLTLTVLEIVLGIDNIVFISVLTSRLPREQQARARTIGLGAALVMRVLLLLTISWIIGLTQPLLTIAGFEFSGRDVVLILGGLFLLWKSTTEIHAALEGEETGHGGTGRATATFGSVILQIGLLDIVFSLDSVITAIGMAKHVGVMITAVVISVVIMLVAAGSISAFVNRHPTVKMLALSFLLLIGMSLIAEGFEFHIPKGYVYFAMGFSIFVEVLNIQFRRKSQPVKLHDPFHGPEAP
jgi:predicted tellurium resistance membrane protein TerC